MGFDLDRSGHFAGTEDLDQAGRFFRLVQFEQVEHLVNDPERMVLETTFWQAALKRGLSPFKTRAFGPAGTTGLPFVSPAAGLAQPGTGPPADPFFSLL